MTEEYKQIGEDKADDFHVLLLTNEEDTEAYLKFLDVDPGCDLSVAQLQDLVTGAGINHGLDENALKDLVERAAAGVLEASDELHLIAKGTPPRHSEDGRVEYQVDPRPEDARLEESDSDEAVDYKKTNLIQNVMPEQALATVLQPTEPVDGINIYGQTIPGREGTPCKVKLGPNVYMDGAKIFSSIAGRFVEEGGVLSVNNIYQVRGDVDYSIGNINFIGSVDIQKDVLDDFSVYGKEGITVGGVVGAASLESDAEIVLNGGANGKGKGFIRSLGKIDSKYFNEMTVVCRADIEVAKHIMNSHVKTKGRLICPHGSLIGGECSALMGIDVGIIGSDLGIMTSVIAGVDYELMDRLKAYESQLAECEKGAKRIDNTIGPLLANKEKLLALDVEKKKKLKSLLQHLKAYKTEMARIRSEMGKLQEETVQTSVKEIHVRKMLYSGVKVMIGKCKRMIKMEVKGPVRLKEDLENDTISITHLTI